MSEYENIFSDEELETISKEFTRLKDKTYLDHAGASLSPDTLLKNVTKDLTENLYLNPHTSKYTTDCIDQVRYMILNHFNAKQDEYSVIFTSGATGSLKTIAESFNFNPNNVESAINKSSAFVYLQDNHTSVLGMRDIAVSKSAEVISIPREDLIEQMNRHEESNNEDRFYDASESLNRALFVYPAQCNFSGYKYPLKWCEYINNGALNEYTKGTFNEWAVVLDAAAFASTNNLDLSKYMPDFVCISFYKIFGYPTGLGVLLVKNNSAHMLDAKTYYGGGTVEIAMSRINYHIKRDILHERFEDGTIPFLSILAVKHGFDALTTIIPNTSDKNIMENISRHTFNLSRLLYNRLKSVHHENGNPIAQFYSDSTYNNINIQGGIINFNLLRANGEFIGYAEVVHMAELFNIYIRSGCFCNPGACQRHLKLSNDDLLKHHKAGHKCGDDNDLINGVPTGSIRVSFGYMSTEKDVHALINMIIECFTEGSPVYKNDHIDSIIIPKMNDVSLVKEENLSKVTHANSNNDHSDLKNYTFKGKLKEIHLFPIKSCASYKVNSWEIGPKGLKYDREWMIVTESGVALTQKQDTRMCLIQPSLDLNENVMKLSFPGVQDISVLLDNSKFESNYKNGICHSKVCGDRIQGYDCGNEVSDWLIDVLGLPGLRLLRQNEDRIKTLKTNKETSISLSNQAQYLMINLASVKWLSAKVKSGEFDDNLNNLTARFRGNLIIETDKEFEEFSWQKVNIGTSVFNINGPCTRCQMVCIDQENGLKTTEPLRTISKELQGKLHFGVYLSHKQIIGRGERILTCGEDVLAIENK